MAYSLFPRLQLCAAGGDSKSQLWILIASGTDQNIPHTGSDGRSPKILLLAPGDGGPPHLPFMSTAIETPNISRLKDNSGSLGSLYLTGIVEEVVIYHIRPVLRWLYGQNSPLLRTKAMVPSSLSCPNLCLH